MSDVRLRLTGEVVYNPEKNGLNIEVTVAHVEMKLGSVQRQRVPWQHTDFHNSVRFTLTQMMQKAGAEIAHRIADMAPNSYLAPPKPEPPLTQGQVTAVASGLPCPPREGEQQNAVLPTPALPQNPPKRGPGRPPKVRVA